MVTADVKTQEPSFTVTVYVPADKLDNIFEVDVVTVFVPLLQVYVYEPPLPALTVAVALPLPAPAQLELVVTFANAASVHPQEVTVM